MTIIKAGIIGCGYIGEKRAEAAKSGGFEVVSVFDVNTDRSNQFAEKTGADSAASEDDVIASDAEVIFISTVHSELARISTKALEAKKHVFVEKPAGISLSELQAIDRAAAKAKKIVKVGLNYRFHPGILKAKQCVEAGEIGDVMFLRARHGHGARKGYEKEWRCDANISGGGELVDQGSHLIDLSHLFINDLSLEFANTPTYYWDTDVEDNVFMCLSNNKNNVAWLSASWTEWKNMFSMEIYGQTGKLMIEGFGGSYGVEKLSHFKMLPEMGPPETSMWEFPGKDNSWNLEMEDFRKSLDGQPNTGATLEDAMKIWQVIEGVKPKKDIAA